MPLYTDTKKIFGWQKLFNHVIFDKTIHWYLLCITFYRRHIPSVKNAKNCEIFSIHELIWRNQNPFKSSELTQIVSSRLIGSTKHQHGLGPPYQCHTSMWHEHAIHTTEYVRKWSHTPKKFQIEYEYGSYTIKVSQQRTRTGS